MKLLPYTRLTLRSGLSTEEVEAKLVQMVHLGWWSFGPLPEPFKGSIEGRRFKIARVLGTFLGLQYRNSFQPVIVGDIVPGPVGTLVRVRMRLHGFVAAFMTVWFGGLFFMAAVLIRGGLGDGFGPVCRGGRRAAGAGVGLAFVGAMLVAGYLFVSAFFWPEVKKAKTLLCEGLSCREVDASRALVR